jgi:phosphonate transport system substrate-binding protein
MLDRGSTIVALAAGLLLGTAGLAHAEDWKGKIDVWRIGIIGGENEADRLKRYGCVKDLVTERFGVPVELYPATDYAGVMQGLIAGQLETAGLGSSGYAGVYLQDADAVEPLVTNEQIDGSRGYYSVLLVRADSPYQSLDDLEGKTLAFADPNSTSGYLVPNFELAKNGYDPAEFFGQTGFAGGHEQGVVALLNGQYDAAVTFTSGVGEKSEGYSRGNLRKMVDKGALDMSDVRILWQSRMITNGPTVVRQELPEEVKQDYKQFLLSLADEHPQCYRDIAGGEGHGFVEVDHTFYEPIIEMRESEIQSRRRS